MSMARLVITAVVVEGRSKSEVARTYGVSRRWVQVLVARYGVEGEAAYEGRSRRPRSSPQRVDDALEDEIVEWRKRLESEGFDAGAVTIAWHLARTHEQVPAVSTIWRVLSRRGFVVAQPHKRPRSSLVRFVADQPNERWQADVTHWALADGTDVEILNIIDDHSRLLIGSDARATFKAGDVVACFHVAAARYGFPASMLTDNGAIFTGAYRGRGRVALEIELAALHIAFRHSRPYHPQTCGKIERFHQTQKKWLARQPVSATITQLQSDLDRFAEHYNTRRPHRALDRQTPAEAYTARPKAEPSTNRPTIADHYRVRHDIIDPSGVITLRYNSQLHHIGIGRRHAGTRVLVLVHDLEIRILTTDGELLRELTLDPTRDYQPQTRT
jgi:transposase InsO family protein